jgi:hypothetical protein
MAKPNSADLALKSLIAGKQDYIGIKDEELAARLGMCTKTYRKRIKSPNQITIFELRILSETLRITGDDIRAAVGV